MDFVAAVRTYQGPLSARAVRLTGDPVEAEDLLQSALLEAWRAWDSRVDSVWTWLTTILRRTWIHIVRDRSRQKRNGHLLPLEYGMDVTLPAPQHAAAELSDVLSRTRHRDTLVRVGMGFSATEIAEAEGISRQAICQRIETARKELR